MDNLIGKEVTVYGRKGIVTKYIGNDVFEVEFPETVGLMARTDRFYKNELIINEGMVYMSNFKKISEELESLLEDSVEVIDSTIEDEINNAQPIDKDFEVSNHAFQIETGDYDYANIVRVEVEERVEKSDYNNPDKEASATETWIADGKEAVVVHFDTELDGPVRPSKIEIKDEHALYDILISLGVSTELFNNQV